MLYIPLWEEEPIKKIEVLYWQSMVDPSWMNSFADEVLKWLFYREKRVPENKGIEMHDYNLNSGSKDYRTFRQRIEALRPHKLRKNPLVVFNHDTTGMLIDSETEFNKLKRRVELERKKYGLPVIPYLL
ncbi:MAG TPA: hypothetical protein VLH19_04660 [Patescibacteria group bacterium]|nr:hypothetical protein [Patescibacteria group bacterium]